MRSSDIYNKLGISDKVTKLIEKAEEELRDSFIKIDELIDYNQLKVIRAMQEEKVSLECMGISTGYGYDDIGRDTLEKVYARIFEGEDALVRSQIVSGTHALSLALTALLRPGDSMLSPQGLPYDTLCTVIGLTGRKGSLIDQGIGFDKAELLADGSFDIERIRECISDKTKLILIQRSRGYAERASFSLSKIAKLIDTVRDISPDVTVLVDNCYGEYTDFKEPLSIGADLIAGSLIKNPGGGIAPVGGYIAGKKELIASIAARLTAPGLEKELGPSLGLNRVLYQGTYFGPAVTGSALKGARLAAHVYNLLGFSASPAIDEPQSDIIAAIRLNSPQRLLSFTSAIQKAACVDSFALPLASPMPGYDDPIVMASGSFISGSSIELSADAPMRPPYTVFLQGGLTYPHARFGVAMSVSQLIADGLLDIK